MKRKNTSSDRSSPMRRPVFHEAEFDEEEQGRASAEPASVPYTIPNAVQTEVQNIYSDSRELPPEAYTPPQEPDYSREPSEAYVPQVPPAELHLAASKKYVPQTGISDDPSDEDYCEPAAASPKKHRSGSDTLYEPRKRRNPVKPGILIVILVVLSVLILGGIVISKGNFQERLASPLTVKDTQISNAEFSFMYHYVLIENGVNIFENGAKEQLSAPGEGGFATNRDYFLDMAAREIQVTNILYDDAVSKGYSITDSEREMAKAYITWLSGKAKAINVDLDTYIQGYLGRM